MSLDSPYMMIIDKIETIGIDANMAANATFFLANSVTIRIVRLVRSILLK